MKKFNGIDEVTSVFSGQSDIVIGKEVADYTSATLEDLFTDGQSLGQVVEDTTSWDGDEPETSPIKDEQGDVITSQVTAGTLAWSAELASTSPEILKVFMKAEDIAGFTGGAVFGTGAKATGFGHNLPVITRPIMIANDEGNKALVFPKAKIVGNFSYSDKLWRVRIAVTAEYIETDNLKTGVLVTGITEAAE